MSALFVQRHGAGPPLVMVHGWAMNAAAWGDWAERLARSYTVYAIELPGHGRSPWTGEATLDGWADRVRAAVPPGAVWVGWSLGAAVTLQAALKAPADVAALVLVSGTPRFVQDATWPNAMAPEVLDQFAELLGDDARATVERFLALQVRGADEATATLRRLKAAMGGLPSAHLDALSVGLKLLRETDLRPQLKRFTRPALWLLGDRDTLVPAAMGWDLTEWMPAARTEIICGAGHAPFLSHLPQLTQRAERFLGVALA